MINESVTLIAESRWTTFREKLTTDKKAGIIKTIHGKVNHGKFPILAVIPGIALRAALAGRMTIKSTTKVATVTARAVRPMTIVRITDF